MPLDAFIAEAMEKFATGDEDFLVERVKMMRANPGPDEWAFVDQFNSRSIQ